jgi:hypothetical protein
VSGYLSIDSGWLPDMFNPDVYPAAAVWSADATCRVVSTLYPLKPEAIDNRPQPPRFAPLPRRC